MKIDIVLNLDDGYAQHCGVAMASVFENNKRHDVTAHLIHIGLTGQNKKKLESIANRYAQAIRFYEVDPARVENLPALSDKHHVKAATYLRLFMADLLPEQIDKVLYLDCDLVVRHDLEELWNTDLTDLALVAMEDGELQDGPKRLGYDERYSYFNAGVLLVNLKYWREKHAMEQFQDFIHHHSEKIVLHDQDVLNAVLHEHKKFMDIKWNVMVSFTHQPPIIQDKYLPVLYDTLDDPYIIHFAAHIKPWHCRVRLEYHDEYYKYLKLTPWRGYRPSLRTNIQMRGGFKGFLGWSGLERYLSRNESKIPPQNRRRYWKGSIKVQ